MLELDSEPVWDYFERISEIPRCSRNEERIVEYVKSVADEHGLDFRQDEAGNVVVRKPATGNDDGPITVLQSHLDMVCEKNEDVDHDFLTDPIPIEREGNWITAEGTTLGADDGIGVAACLAIATSDEIEHGPLEFLFTVEEETGLGGASELETDLLEGRRLVNLDSEEFGTFTVGCAGSGNSEISLPIETVTLEEVELTEISISGLKGGHSGVDINRGRANSIKVLGRLLWGIHRQTEGRILLHDVSGGDKDNAIPRESSATLSVKGSVEDVERTISELSGKVGEGYRDAEPDMKINIEKLEEENETELLTPESSRRAIYLIQALPHGVLSMSQKIPGLVKTSTNLATVARKEDGPEISMKTRSSSSPELEAVRDQIRATAELAGADVEETRSYPGWEPDTDSELLETFKDTFRDVFGEEPETKAIHAGLETGIIGEKFEDMDMISIGPTIKNPHSPDERVNIGSVRNFWKHLTESLKAMAE